MRFAPFNLVAGVTACLVVSQACVFELAELVDPGVGGAGGTAQGGGGEGGNSGDWWDPAYGHRVRVGFIDVTADVDDARLPLFIDASFPYADAASDGVDLRVVDLDGTLLPHEIERWDPAGSLVWVRVPRVSIGTITKSDGLWLYFGNPAATAAEDPAGLWDDYIGVYHLGEDLGSTSVVRDSSPNGHDGTAIGFAAGSDVEGPLAGATNFGPTGPRSIDIVGDEAFDVASGQDRTIELWFRWDTLSSGFMFSKEACCIGYSGTSLGDGQMRQTWRSGSCCSMPPEGDYVYNQFFIGSPSDWHHAVFVYDRSTTQTERLYIDGMLGGEAPIDSGPGLGGFGQFRIGSDFGGTSSWPGMLDEFRVRNGIPSPERIQLDDRAGRDQLLSFSAAESLP
jgi:Concanavalin A-like lectin/glucanases superfamily/Domain of unknown function (DUF2341)